MDKVLDKFSKIALPNFNVNKISENIFLEYLIIIRKMLKMKQNIKVTTLFSGIGAV